MYQFKTVLLSLIQIGFSIALRYPESRIVNGIPISANLYPWMAGLRILEIYNETYAYEDTFCGGSLIHLYPPIVLTAAHCVDDFGYDNITDTILDLSDNSTLPPTVHFYVDINRTYPNHIVEGDVFTTLSVDYFMIEMHPLYNESNVENDIALIIFNDHNPQLDPLPDLHPCDLPVVPPPLALNEPCCYVNDLFITMGYGLNASDSDYSTYSLEETVLHYVNETDCARDEIIIDYNTTNETLIAWVLEHHFEPDHTIICAVGNDTDTCSGDSGGPLFNYINGSYINESWYGNYTWYWHWGNYSNYTNYTWYGANYSNYTECSGDMAQIVGVTSFGYGDCADGYPSGYTSIAHFYDWIYDTIDAHLGSIYTYTDDNTESSSPNTGDDEFRFLGAKGTAAVVSVTIFIVVCVIVLCLTIVLCIYFIGIIKGNRAKKQLVQVDNDDLEIEEVVPSTGRTQTEHGVDQVETEGIAQPMINATN